MYPKKFFTENKVKEISGRTFVIMPFDPPLRAVFDSVSDILSGDEFAFECIRSDDLSKGGHILEDVLRGIAEAEIVVADLTDRNPNVLYELGIAHMRKNVSQIILIDQGSKKLPFDVGAYRCIRYSMTENGLKALRRKIADAVRHITSSDIRFTIRRDQPFKLHTNILGSDRYMYGFAIPHCYLGRGFAKVRVDLTRLVPGKAPAPWYETSLGLRNGEARDLMQIGWRLTLERASDKGAVFHLSEVNSPRSGRQKKKHSVKMKK